MNTDLDQIAADYQALLKEQAKQRFEWMKQHSSDNRPIGSLSSVCNFLNNHENPLVDKARLNDLAATISVMFSSPFLLGAKHADKELTIKQLIYLLSSSVPEVVITNNEFESLLIRNHLQQALSQPLFNRSEGTAHD
ncbi:hypothetical protein [Pseudoalteromonas sp. NZS100]|uniref:hypothetical protein n=1 Tax=Pseudoalteromonas sp. NZS100 TaxID=2792046 RepID=UPI0018CFE8DC|nr:hypothetical protein [Pseudoalteromonas sp. NZS100]MBH0066768.1 hypothetical protein [Pseudoalteromonas sp. NZS100]